MRTYDGYFNTGDLVIVTYPIGITHTMRVLSGSTYTFTEMRQDTITPEKNAKLKKAKAQYQAMNDWRNKRKR